MKTFFKNLFKFIVFLFLLLLIISLLVRFFVDINHYKKEISQFVENETGLQLELNGDMHLSVISGLKLELEDVKLLNANILIADIKTLHLGIGFHSFYGGKPEISSLELAVRTLNISRNRHGHFNFLPTPILDIEKSNNETHNKSQEKSLNQIELKEISLNHLMINDIELSIEQFKYLDDLESLSVTLDSVKTSLSLLPVIDHHELVIDDPRVLVAYSYSGHFYTKKATINQYQLSDVSLEFKDDKGSFIADKVAFHLIKEGKKHALPSLVIDAEGQLSIDIAYQTLNGKSEPDWEKPDIIKLGKFDFKLPVVEISDDAVQIKTKNSQLSFNNITIFKASKYRLNDFYLTSLNLDSNQLDLKSKDQGEYHLKKVQLKVKNFPLMENSKLYEFTSAPFIKKFAENGQINFSSDSLISKDQGLNKVNIVLQGKDNKINLSSFSFHSMESQVMGEGYIAVQQKIPQWQLKIQSEDLNLSPISNLLNTDIKITGYASVNNTLSGYVKNSEFNVSSGTTHIKAKNLLLKGIDLDKILNDLKSSQNISLLDVGGVALLGPAGMLVTKGNDYRTLSQNLSIKGESKIKQLNSEIIFDNEIATMKDVAFSTEQFRLAVKGKINIKDQLFSQFEVATLDQYGCPNHKEVVHGTLVSPKVKKVNVLVGGVVNPISSIISRVTKKCKEPFYSGVVQAPY